MLTIAKLAAGGEDYYLSTVAPTVEDYYTGEGEAPGRWIGRGAETLALSGVVAPVALRHVLGARSPDGEPLLAQSQRKVPGFDLTFRAPKSVSLLWALSDDAVSAKVRQAHDRAVAASLDYLERHAAKTRRGKGGAERVPVDGLVAAAFRHRTSRADDPLLHTHVLVANVGRTSDDGAWRTLDGRQLYLHAKTAGYLYQSHLRDELTRELGVDWQPVTNGYADIAGVPRDLIEAFSRRRAQILERLDEVGHHSAAAAQVATLATRPAKSHAPVDRLRERWRERSREHGFGPRQVARLLGRATPHVADPARLRPLAEQPLVPRRAHLPRIHVRAPRGHPRLVRRAPARRLHPRRRAVRRPAALAFLRRRPTPHRRGRRGAVPHEPGGHPPGRRTSGPQLHPTSPATRRPSSSRWSNSSSAAPLPDWTTASPASTPPLLPPPSSFVRRCAKNRQTRRGA